MIKQQSGAALLSALLIMALCAIVATFLMMGQRQLIHQASLVTTSDRMILALGTVQTWAKDTIESQPDIRKVKAFRSHANGLKTSGMIYALGGRFNVNALQLTDNIPKFVTLLHAVVPNIDDKQAKALASQLSQWLLSNNQVERYYLSLIPPYRAAHQKIVDLSELRLIQGMTPELYALLVSGKQTYLTALPVNNISINVNYMTEPVLASVTQMNPSQAETLIQCRDGSGYFQTVSDFIKRCGSGMTIDQSSLTTDNFYYLVKGKSVMGEQRMQMQALIYAKKENNKVKAQIQWQEFNSE